MSGQCLTTRSACKEEAVMPAVVRRMGIMAVMKGRGQERHWVFEGQEAPVRRRQMLKADLIPSVLPSMRGEC